MSSRPAGQLRIADPDESHAASESIRFVRQAHAVLRDLQSPHLARYWLDFLATIAVVYASLTAYLHPAVPPAVQVAACLACALSMYRAVVFTHELTHQQGRSFRSFRIAWNALCGIPFLLPSFLYGDHKGHHTNACYGTPADPEYLIRASGSRGRVIAFLLLAVVYPVLPVVRFLVLTPLAAVSRHVDRWVWTYASSLYLMNESYHRVYGTDGSDSSRWLQEIACALWAWGLIGLVATGTLPWTIVPKVYVLSLVWMSVNQVRTLAAHRYANDEGATLTYLEQLLDTNTFDRGAVLPHLWAPLGLRYHALHHLMPTMPYHAMGEAHRRLLAARPDSSPYHQTLRPGLWAVLVSRLRPPAPGRC